jgi:hypothetical protein
MLARTPWIKPLKIAPPKPKRLTKDRARSIREKIVPVMREVEPTPFAAEGPCRAGIRSSLCLQGWPWLDADTAAAEVVAAALHVVGARRPTWYQGQPDFAQPGVTPIVYDRCRQCRGPIPEGRRAFCCIDCKQIFHGRRASQAHSEEARTRHAAWYAARSSKLPEQVCDGCGRSYRPKRPGQRFCSVACVNLAYAGGSARK